VIQKSRELFLENAPEGLLYHVDLTDDAAAEEGMVCGGILEILLERY
jgi:xanthine dehydrogenase accessory factor subfamily protein